MKVLLLYPESVKKESKSIACSHLEETLGLGKASVIPHERQSLRKKSRTDDYFGELATAKGPLRGLTSDVKSPTKETSTLV